MLKTILKLPAVKKHTALSRSTIYLLMSKNEFPASISLGDRAVGWLEEDIEQWIEEKINAKAK